VRRSLGRIRSKSSTGAIAVPSEVEVEGSAVPVIDCRDSVRLVEDEGRSKPIDRSRIKLVQTPQTFRGDILMGAYMMDHPEDFTDEATVVEIAGHEVRLIEGEETNIKITTPADMTIAEQLLGRRG